jgi:class 3 adenylate cyclase
VDLDALTAAGLYDAIAPDAAERLELLTFLIDQGCSVDEMVAAHSRGRLFALAGDRIVRPARDQLTLQEVAEKLGVDVADVRATWRALGLVDLGPDTAVASPDDVEMVHVVLDMASALGLAPTLGVARVMGAALSRIGDAASTVVRGNMPDMSVAVSGSELTTARSFALVAGMVPRIGSALDTLFRHHLEAARMHFERTDSWEVVGAGGIRVGVGFADLTGFTGLTQRLALEDLSQLLSGFETVAADVVHDHGARVVKFLGDAVMYVAVDAATAANTAAALLDAANARGMQARAGVTVGTVLALDGDYFGPVVNLAARLVAIAETDTIFASEAVVERLDDAWSVDPLGPQPIRGFDEPVAVSRLSRAEKR